MKMSALTFKNFQISFSPVAIGPPVDGEVEVEAEQFEAGHPSQESCHLGTSLKFAILCF